MLDGHDDDGCAAIVVVGGDGVDHADDVHRGAFFINVSIPEMAKSRFQAKY